jgi:hypothetical protein
MAYPETRFPILGEPDELHSETQLRAPNPSLWGCEAFADVTIRFSGRELKCHKIILHTNSDYFRTSLVFGAKLQVSVISSGADNVV